jgi:hypothetical protein
MAATDLVPCFYTGQDYRVEKPAEVRTRAEVREWKRLKLGKFVENGKYFLFFKALMVKIARYWDGPIGVGNALPFAKAHNYGDKLHYEMPMAGDGTPLKRHNLYRRDDQLKSRTIHVSSRNLFAHQPLSA